jgi:DNA-binding transcriptional regulator YiaG
LRACLSTISVEIREKTSIFIGMSPEQSRAARAWLSWSQEELARRANVSLSTVRDHEKGRHAPIAATLAAMRRAVETAGIEFIEEDGKPVGIRVLRDAPGNANPTDATGDANARR